MISVSETNRSLWWLPASPTIWAAHFISSYATASIWCAKAAQPEDSLWQVRVAIGVYSIIALGAIGIIGWIGYGRYRSGRPPTVSGDAPEDRYRFLGLATLLLSGLSGIGTGYAALVLFFFRRCI